MALSDALLKLSNHSKELEQSIEATQQKNDARIEARRVELQSELDDAAERFDRSVDSAADQAASDWAEAQKSVSDAFESLRADARSRHAEWSAKRASRAADVAEADAIDAVDFAIYAIQEAEYAVLDASDARAEADLKAT